MTDHHHDSELYIPKPHPPDGDQIAWRAVGRHLGQVVGHFVLRKLAVLQRADQLVRQLPIVLGEIHLGGLRIVAVIQTWCDTKEMQS